MAEIKINLPAKMTLTAGEAGVRFMPYKENFVTNVAANTSLTIGVDTLGQYLYYKKQGFVEGEVEGAVVINAPATITIVNNTGKEANFIPYRENFQQEVAAGDSYVFNVKTAGQTLYYLAQDTNGEGVEGGLDVTQTAVASGTAVTE